VHVEQHRARDKTDKKRREAAIFGAERRQKTP
jgi:hypothetical protein